jgi:hypothetical protein
MSAGHEQKLLAAANAAHHHCLVPTMPPDALPLPAHLPGLTDAVMFVTMLPFAAARYRSAIKPFVSALVACWLQLPLKLNAIDISAM